MSAMDFAARAKAIEARQIATGISSTAEAASTAARQAEGKADAAKTAADVVSATLETSRKDIEAAAAAARTAGDVAAAASKAAQAAEQLAHEAAASAPRLFADLAAAGLPAGVSKIDSTGHIAESHGAASYISDEAATAALAAAHPLACFAGAGKRHFRLLPDAQGYITPEQLGCPPYAPGVNAQPYVQAALDYAHAMRKRGVKGVAFNQTDYEIWATMRNPDISHNAFFPWVRFEESGIPLIVRSRTGMKAAPIGTTFHRRTWEGKDPSVWANTQVLNGGTAWRGGMFLFAHPVGKPRPADYDELPGMDMVGRWKIMGGIPVSDKPGWHFPDGYDKPSRLLDGGQGWDETDKAFWWQNDVNTGDLTFEHLEIDGFRGELLYQGGQGHGSIIGRRLICSNTDGDGLNPDPHYCSDGSLGRLDIEHVTIHNTYQALEGGTGWGHSRIGVLEMYDNLRASGLMGGPFATQASGKFVHPKDAGYDPPRYLSYDPTWNIGRVIVTNSGTYEVVTCTTIGEVVAKDTAVSISLYYKGGHDISIGRITLITNKIGPTFVINGVDNANQTAPTNIYIGEVVHQRTHEAVNAERFTKEPFIYMGKLFGPNIRVGRLTGSYATSMRVAGSAPEGLSWMPCIEAMSGGYAGHSYDLVSEGIPDFVRSSFLNLYSYVPGHHFVRLPSCHNRYQAGHRLKLTTDSNTMVISIDRQNTRLSRPFLMTRHTPVEFECDGYAWVCLSPDNRFTQELALTIAKNGGAVAPGEWSDEVELAVPNVSTGMVGSITPPNPWPRTLNMQVTVADGKIFVRAQNTHPTEAVPARTAATDFCFTWA